MLEKLKEIFPAIREKEPLKNHCTFRCGGPADFFYLLSNIEELPELIRLAETHRIPYFVFGSGSNILFSDKGFRGLAIKIASTEIQLIKDSNNEETIIEADAGAPLAKIISFSLENGLTGLEKLAGIPGTIGGAVFGNAGVPRLEIGSFVESVSVFDPELGIRDMSPELLCFDYRHSVLKNQYIKENFCPVILRVKLRLKKGDTEKAREEFKQADIHRREKQPQGLSAGSFFQNPTAEKPAGMLIEKAGCKGLCVGNAKVSEKHANFFVNEGEATAENLLELATMVKRRVLQTDRVSLVPEVRILDETGKLIEI